MTAHGDPFELVLARLNKVRRSNDHNATASCPAHEDRTPSLAVSRKDDGVLLVNCRAGCDIGDVMGAIGLSLRDLYPEGAKDHRVAPVPIRNRWEPRELLRIIDNEAVTVAVAADFLAASGELPDESLRARLWKSAERIRGALERAG